MRIVAIIPARGGSKGIVRKNLERVGGRTLIARSIDHARRSRLIDGVVVTTDDDAIATVADRAGARVIDRPAELSDDVATTESAVQHALDQLRNAGESPEIIVLLQCTSPFRSPGQLDAAIAQFETTGCDSLLSVCEFRQFLWTSQVNARGFRALTYDPRARPRRQDIDDIHCETGSFYIFRPEVLETTGSRLGGHIEVFQVPTFDALEIDEPADLERARVMAVDEHLELGEDLANVEWLVLDVDGTLTDGAMYYAEGGEVSKRFDTRDGFGLRLWREAGGKIAWISGEASEATARRAAKLGIDHVALGIADKAAELRRFADLHCVDRKQIVAMGDDLNDLPLRGGAVMFAAPANAQRDVLAQADLVTRAGGGYGAVRELTDLLLRARGQIRSVRQAA